MRRKQDAEAFPGSDRGPSGGRSCRALGGTVACFLGTGPARRDAQQQVTGERHPAKDKGVGPGGWQPLEGLAW